MTTAGTETETEKVNTARVFASRLSLVNLIWVAIAVIYVVTQFSQMDYRLVYAWVVVEFFLGLALFALSVRKRP
jgi:hypothetical protein